MMSLVKKAVWATAALAAPAMFAAPALAQVSVLVDRQTGEVSLTGDADVSLIQFESTLGGLVPEEFMPPTPLQTLGADTENFLFAASTNDSYMLNGTISVGAIYDINDDTQDLTALIGFDDNSSQPIAMGDIQYTNVPEPSLGLLAVTGSGLLLRRRRA